MRFLTPEWHEELPSTNTVLLERVRSGHPVPGGFVLAARSQTAGRGRYDRRWQSEAGQNLTFSFLYPAKSDGTRLASLPLAIALGISDTMTGYAIATRVKWPNDVLIDRAKLSGMLLERTDVPHPEGTPIVVGIGLNVNMNGQTAALIDRPATSMYLETGHEYPVEGVLARILDTLPTWLDKWEHGGFPAIQHAWEDRCAFLGESISVGEGHHVQKGRLEGFGANGQLLLRTARGGITEIWAGDVAAI
jgi:BirA family transcriptional regulator, biotin operon repressor / biotin---[acetyl-CoA-carboxylase] ligase